MPVSNRHSFWVDTLHDIQLADGAGSITTLLGGVSIAESRAGMTVIRLILCWQIQALVQDQGEGQQNFDVGIGITGTQAFTTGAAAVASPSAETQHPPRGWLFRCRGTVYGFATDSNQPFTRILERDLRAKRKLDNGDLFLRFESIAEQGAGQAMSLIGITRALILSS